MKTLKNYSITIIIFTMSLLLVMSANAQHISYQIDETGDYFYQETFKIKSSSNDLISKSKVWVYETFDNNYELESYEIFSPHVILVTGRMYYTTVKILIETKNNHCKMTIYDIHYAQKGKVGYNSTKVRNGCKEDIYLNTNSYYFFKKNGKMRKSSKDLFYTIHNRVTGLFYSLENSLNEKIYNNEDWEKSLLR